MNITKYILFSCFVLGFLFLFGCKEHPVIDAVEKGNVSAVDEYLKNNGDPNRRNNAGESLLMLASYHRHSAIVEDLLKAGADVNAKKDSHTALEYAFYQGYMSNSDTVELLLEAGAEVTDKDLLNVIKTNDIDVVKLFFKVGTEININKGEQLPLIVASRQPLGYKIMQLLLRVGADVNAQDEHGNTALIAVDHDVLKKTKLLLGAGADVNAQNLNGDTALMRAVERLGIDYNIYNSKGDYYSDRILMDARERIKLLLKAKANVNATNNNGETALIKAAEVSKNPETVTLLLKAGADINAKDKHGYTALMKASWLGHTEIVKLLLKAGADVNAKDIDGDTAIRIARRSGHADIVKILKASGAQSL